MNGEAGQTGKRGAVAMKYIPLEKQSKRAQKAHHDRQRGSWNGVTPVTRVVPSRKAYDRNRVRQADRGIRSMEG